MRLDACRAGAGGSTDEAAATAHAQAQTPGDDDDPDDPVQWIIDEGFSSIHFMQRCVSVGEDGSEISTAPLPVGNGRKLGKVYWVLGALSSSEAAGDDRLELI